MKRLSSFVASCLVLVILNDPASGQTHGAPLPPPYLVDQYYRASKRTIDLVLDDIRNAVSSSDRRQLDNIDFRVNRNDWNIYGVFARRGDNRRSIELSIGFVIALDHIDTAVVAQEVTGVGTPVVIDYVQAFVDSVHENMRRMRRGEGLLANPSFPEFVGWSREEWQRVLADGRFGGLRDLVKLHSMAFIVGHEFAHHSLGHLDNRESSVEEEMEADERAIEIALAADYNPVVAITSFLFFAAIEGDTGIYDGTDTHPPPTCRMRLLLRAGIDDAVADPGFLNHLHQTGQYEQWSEQVNALESLIDDARFRCP